MNIETRALRRSFVLGLFVGLRVVWPILWALLALIVAPGIVGGVLEDWSVQESLYCAFVSGLTIGYGDLAPKALLAVLIGICGVLAAVSTPTVRLRLYVAALLYGRRDCMGEPVQGSSGRARVELEQLVTNPVVSNFRFWPR
jgi:hypothetical protein